MFLEQRKFFCTLVLFFVPFVLSAQVKQYICIVKEQYHPEIVSLLEDYRDLLKNKGYASYADSVDTYLKGHFGSGFVYIAKNGTNYIITNRHVVSQAASVVVEFEDDGGEKTVYENLTVLNADEELDLAVLSFPDGVKPFKKGLSFSSKNVKDGQDVWSAGFPGVGGEPVWQFGKGTVTNAFARIKDLVDPDITALIQHSAQVDGGNSGGPLLIKAGSAYSVVGVNTWKYASRQDTNYSIPSEAVKTYLERVLSPAKGLDSKEQLEKRVQAFTAAVLKEKNEFTDIAKYVSYACVTAEGKELFLKVLASAPSKVRAAVSSVFSYHSPVEGMRLAAAWNIWSKIKENRTFENIESGITEKDGVFIVNFSNAEIKAESEWIFEQGVWRIKHFGEPFLQTDGTAQLKEKKSSKASAQSYSGIGFEIGGKSVYNIQLGYGIPLTKKVSGDFSASFLYLFGSRDMRFVGIGGTLLVDALEIFPNVKSIRAFLMPALALQMPFSVSKFSAIPFFKAGGGINMAITGQPGSGVFIEPGIQMGYKLNGSFNVLLGLSYRHLWSFPAGQKIRLQKGAVSVFASLFF